MEPQFPPLPTFVIPNNFTPSPTAAGGNRAQRRAAFKKLPRAVKKGADLGTGFKDAAMNADTSDTDANKTDAEKIEEAKQLVETIYANHKHPKMRGRHTG